MDLLEGLFVNELLELITVGSVDLLPDVWSDVFLVDVLGFFVHLEDLGCAQACAGSVVLLVLDG